MPDQEQIVAKLFTNIDNTTNREKIHGSATSSMVRFTRCLPHLAARTSFRKMFLLFAVAVTLVGLFPKRAYAAYPRTHTVTLTFVDNASYPGRLTNAGIGFKQLQTFFDTVQFKHDVNYSFNNDVLGGQLLPSRGYISTPNGYGYGVNGAASLLNNLVYNAAFWDRDGIEKPVFQRVHVSILRLDRSYTVYGVNVFPGQTDYIWRLNPAYDGPSPRAAITFDANAATAAITLNYADEIMPPSRDLPLTAKGALLSQNLQAIIGDRRLGVSVIPVDDPNAAVSVNPDVQVPVASAWKGGGIVYFFENVDPAVWTSIPVKYWNLRNVARVPPEYQKAFLQYNKILRWVYVMGVFSGNHEAGDVLDYVYRNSKWKSSANAVAAFNDWSQQVVGLSAESGLHKWQAGATWAVGIVDHRLDGKPFIDGGRQIPFDNTFSARDLSKFYLHLATEGRKQGYYDTVIELLSTRTDILSMLKSFSSDTGIQAASKIGYFAPDSPDSLGHDVNNDGGLLTLPDGEQYAVASMAFDAVDIQGDVVSTISRTLVNTYQRMPTKP